jgi:type IV secretion system protein VirB3
MAGKTKYSAYAGLGRVAMVWGVPLMPLMIVGCASVFVALPAAVFLGPGGLLFATPGVPVVLFMRRMSETDDQALRILWLELRCVMRRRAWWMFGRTLTLAPIRYGRSLKVYRRPFRKQTGFMSSRTSI